MSSFYADSFCFISDKPQNVCAFLTSTRPFFNSSIIPVTLNVTTLWERLCYTPFNRRLTHEQCLLELFTHSHTLQFSPTIRMSCYRSDEATLLRVLVNLVSRRRYFCRTLKHFEANDENLITLVCAHVKSLETLTCDRLSIVTSTLIGKMTMLRKLDLSGGFIESDECFEQLSALVSLVELILRDLGDFSGAAFRYFSGMKSLRELDVSIIDLSLSDEGISHLPFLPSLHKLRFYEAEISDIGFAAITRQKNLRALDVTLCRNFTLPSFKGIAKLRDLVELDLTWNCQVDDAAVRALMSMEGSLRHLVLTECHHVTDDSLVPFISKMTDLVCLDVLGCNISDATAKAISKLQQLKKLTISNNSIGITDDGLMALKNIPHLEELELRSGDEFGDMNSEISDQTLISFSEMKHRHDLLIEYGDQFTDKGIEALASSSSLRRLKFHTCRSITCEGIIPISKSNSLSKLSVISCGKIVEKECRKYFDRAISTVDFELM